MTGKITTEELIEQYKNAARAYVKAGQALHSRAVEECGFSVGDIVEFVPGKFDRAESVTRVITRLIGKVSTIGKISIEVVAKTRRRTATGWHRTENEHYTFANRSEFGCGYWKVIGHDAEVSEASLDQKG
jgi:hypothetical protein